MAISYGSAGNMYFCSYSDGLPKGGGTMKDNIARCYDLPSRTYTELPLEPYIAPLKPKQILGSNYFGPGAEQQAEQQAERHTDYSRQLWPKQDSTYFEELFTEVDGDAVLDVITQDDMDKYLGGR
jgi:hypothetical protein